MSGRSEHGFRAGLADITRAEMAVALVSLVGQDAWRPALQGDVRQANDDGLFVFGSTPGTGDQPNDNFTDAIRRTQPRHINNAISAAYELGITSGSRP